jgi:AcrR family transcriptional regulator
MIRCVVYCSQLSGILTDSELGTLAASAQTFNAGCGVTGRLLHLSGRFIQAVEGPDNAVAAVLERISADRRHKKLVILLDEQQPARSFAGWHMDHISPRDLTETEAARFFDVLNLVEEGTAELPTEGIRMLELLAGVGPSFVTEMLRKQPRQARAMITIDRLLGVTRQFIQRHRMEDLTVDAVAVAANVSAPTAYRYFATPSELLRGLVRQSQARNFQQFRIFLAQSEFKTEAELAHAVARFLSRSYMSETRAPEQVLLALLRHHHDIAFDEKWVLAGEVGAVMQRCGIANADSTLEARLATALGGLAGAIKTIALRDMALLRTQPFREVLAGMFLGALRGVQAPQSA